MPTSGSLPSPMCPSCKFYEYHAGSSGAHVCKNSGSFTNNSKLGKNPPAGTCKTFKPR